MKEYVVITVRIISILGLALFMILVAGRRKIAELPVFDFVVFITLGAVIGADIADPSIHHLPTAYSVILLTGIQYLYSVLILNNRKIGGLSTFDPVVVIENGELVKGNLKKLKYSLDNILMMLREKGVFDLNEVEFAVIESSGKISVLKKTQYRPITPQEIKLNTEYKGLSIPLIVEGEIYQDNLDQLDLNRDWLNSTLQEKNIYSIDSVFYAAINTKGELYVSQGLEDAKNMHILRH